MSHVLAVVDALVPLLVDASEITIPHQAAKCSSSHTEGTELCSNEILRCAGASQCASSYQQVYESHRVVYGLPGCTTVDNQYEIRRISSAYQSILKAF